MKIVACVRFSAAASASACAWLPDDDATTPASSSLGDSWATVLYAPRNLNAPTRWKPSALRCISAPTRSSIVREVSTGVRCATPFRRAAARSTSARAMGRSLCVGVVTQVVSPQPKEVSMLGHVRRHAVAYLALAVALGSAGTYAATTLVGSDGTITGCVKQNGLLRVVAAGKDCAQNERRLRFNQRGVKGATGAAGAVGTQGSPGQQGGQGDKGDRGTAMVAKIRSTAETNLQYSPNTTV